MEASLSFVGYKELGVGRTFTVLSSVKIPKQCSKAPEEDQDRVHSILKVVSDSGLGGFPDTDIKFEVRYPSGLSAIPDQAVYVVKSFQLRVYFGIVSRFLVLVEGTIKKENEADQKQLKRVAKELGRLNDQYQKSIR